MLWVPPSISSLCNVLLYQFGLLKKRPKVMRCPFAESFYSAFLQPVGFRKSDKTDTDTSRAAVLLRHLAVFLSTSPVLRQVYRRTLEAE